MVVLCCMQSGSGEASLGERTQWEDHKIGGTVCFRAGTHLFLVAILAGKAMGFRCHTPLGTSGNAGGTQRPQHRDVPVASCSEQTFCLSPAFVGQFYVHSP